MTSTAKYRYCKLYVRDWDRPKIYALIELSLGAVVDGDQAIAGGLLLDVRENDEADVVRADDFLYWPVIIDVTADPSVDDSAVVASIGGLLRSAWSSGIDVVAACPFEDELPSSGGIRRLRPP